MARNNSPLGMQFRTCENFGDFADSKSSLNPQNSHKYKSHTANTRIVDSGESSLRGESMDSPKQSKQNQNANSSIVSESQRVVSEAKQKLGLCSHERGNKTKASIDEASGKLPDLSPQDEFAKTPKFRSIIVGASGLSLGISIVVAILLGIGAGILMQKIFGVFWVLFLGVFWGIAAAVLNVYKVYKAELRDFEKLANDPKYKSTNPK